MACQLCQARVPTKDVTISQNVGLVILRFYSATQGQLCRACIGKEFWRRTLITWFFGWWGIISAIFTPLILAGNVGSYLAALPMPHEGPEGPWIPTEDEKRRGLYYKLIAVGIILAPFALFVGLIVVVALLQQLGILSR
jgi:hypothetical protein